MGVELAFAKKRKVHVPPALPVPLADTHAHTMSFWGAKPAEAIARAVLAGVQLLVTLADPIGDKIDLEAFPGMLEGWMAEASALLEESAAGGAVVAAGAEAAGGGAALA